MSTEDLLQAGIRAAKAGDPVRASNLLGQFVRVHPNSELGWLWLGLCRINSEQREYCFRRVLAINPENLEASRQLEVLNRLISGSPEAQPVVSHAPALVSAPLPVEPPREERTTSQKPSTPPPAKRAVRPKPQKSGNQKVLWAGGIGFLLLVCISVAGIFILSQAFRPGNSPVPGSPSPTILPTTTTIPATPVPQYSPAFEPADCPFETPLQARVSCGFVIVPEDRSGDLSDTIQLAVAVYHSTSSTPRRDPILYLQGGPGSEALHWSAGRYEDVIVPQLADQDFIVFDPRGVGYSEPNLTCEEFGKTYLQDLEGKIPSDQRASYYEGALLTCKNNLVRQGANISTYTSVATAADARDVLTALGYSQANLYGISYGTRIAQLMMRDHPQVVRSAILDSVVPIETQLLSQSSDGQDYALQTLFADCKADPVCSAAYPELEAVYNEVFNQLNAQPINRSVEIDEDRTLERFINGYTLRNTILWTLRMPETIGLAPRLIYQTRAGDYTSLTPSLAIPILTFDSISLGAYISVNCHEQVFAIPLENLGQTVYDLCELWGATPLLPGENDPVHSDIPTLIFAGRYDSTTPPAFAHQVAGNLTRSFTAEIPNQGHAPSASGLSECPTTLISRFLLDPHATLDLTCVSETGTIRFIVPQDPGAPLLLEPTKIDQYQVNTSIPAGWNQEEFGFYSRNGFWSDAVQIAVQRAPVAPSEWVAWLGTNFGGSQGFDQAPTLDAQHQANGMTWSIYKTGFRGHPIDLAFAESNNQTMMVLLVSYLDEHDALYSQVFLPVIDSTTPSR